MKPSFTDQVANRKRRTKCDEGRPKCQRCLRGGYVCDGYAEATFEQFRFIDREDNLLPDQSNSREITPPSTILTSPTSNLKFRDQLQQQYFQNFRSACLPELSRGFCSPLWNQIVLRICHDADHVRDASTALAALSMSKRKARSNPLVSRDHYQYALRQYGYVVKSLRESIVTKTCTTRIGIVTSLMLFAFEGMMDDRTAALSHLDRVSDLSRDSYKKWGLYGTHSETETGMEYELVAGVAMLTGQGCTFLGRGPQDSRLRKNLLPQIVPGGIETNYDDLRALERHLCMTLYAGIYYVGACVDRIRGQLQRPDEGNVLQPLWGYDTPHYEHLLPLHTRQEHWLYLRDSLRLEAAFDIFVTTSPKAIPTNITAILRLSIIYIRVLLISLFIPSEFAWDQYVLEFQTGIAAAQTLLLPNGQSPTPTISSSSTDWPSFIAEGNILCALFFLAITCRHRSLRRQVLSLLRIPRHEGLWHSACLLKMAEWIIELEEGSAATEYYSVGADSDSEEEVVPEEEKRVKIRSIRCFDGGTVEVVCLRWNQTCGKHADVVRKMIRWKK